MVAPALSFHSLARRPSAFLPLILSLLALAAVLAGPTLFGDRNATDEGPSAHLWQIFMAAQLPFLAFFLFQGLRRAPRPTLQVFALLAGAVAANFAAVFFLT